MNGPKLSAVDWPTLAEQMGAKPAPPTDPRERALWAKQHRGTGPEKVLPTRRDYHRRNRA